MELEQLHQIEMVAREGTMSKAALQLNISQPALSRSMQRLEAELGQPLFNRGKNHVELNEAGRVVVDYSQGILRLIGSMQDALGAIAHASRTLRIGSCAPAPLWKIVPTAIELLPGRLIDPRILLPEELEERVIDGTLDFVITPHMIKNDNVLSEPVMQERISISLPIGHRYESREEVACSDMDGETFLIFGDIGHWKALAERDMPHSRFVVQEDYRTYLQLTVSSPLPFFVTSLEKGYRPSNQRKVVSISGSGSCAVYYASIRRDRRPVGSDNLRAVVDWLRRENAFTAEETK